MVLMLEMLRKLWYGSVRCSSSDCLCPCWSEHLRLKLLHSSFIAATKENLLRCKLVKYGVMDALSHGLGLCPSSDFLGGKGKRTGQVATWENWETFEVLRLAERKKLKLDIATFLMPFFVCNIIFQEFLEVRLLCIQPCKRNRGRGRSGHIPSLLTWIRDNRGGSKSQTNISSPFMAFFLEWRKNLGGWHIILYHQRGLDGGLSFISLQKDTPGHM